jgi:hypothetical protein
MQLKDTTILITGGTSGKVIHPLIVLSEETENDLNLPSKIFFYKGNSFFFSHKV